MSYLSLPGLPSFDKCIISFWFKIPQASLSSARGDSNSTLSGIVPLVVMGNEGTGDIPTNTTRSQVPAYIQTGTWTTYYYATFVGVDCTDLRNVWAGLPGYPELWCCFASEFHYHVPPSTVESIASISYANIHITAPVGPPQPTPPSCIGVDQDGYLYVNFETGKKASVSNAVLETQSISPVTIDSSGNTSGQAPGDYTATCDRSALPCYLLLIECFPSGWTPANIPNVPASPPPGEAPCYTNNWVDISDLSYSATGALTASGSIKAAPDTWHHVLVSVDMSKGVKVRGAASNESWTNSVSAYVDSAAKVYIALDDKNHTEWDVADYWSWPNGGPNDALTSAAYAITGSLPQTDSCNGNEFQVGGIANYTLANMSVPAAAAGIPATAKYTSNIHQCEMAEFQMWVGQSIDPASESVRRLFLGPKKSKSGLYPVDPATAAKALGKQTVLLHTSNNWIEGKDTGTAGKFVPTGKIKKYKPDPSIAA